MPSFNKVVLVGNLVATPELRYTPQGTAVTDVTVAVNDRVGDGKEETSFVDCVFWGKTAENSSKYLDKGSSVLVEGRLRQRKWEDKETGKTRSKIEITASRVVFLSMKSERVDDTQNQKPKQQEEGDDNNIPF